MRPSLASAAAWALLALAVPCVPCEASAANNNESTSHHSEDRRLASQVDTLLSHLDAVQNQIDTKLFLYQTPAFQWVPSSVYQYADFRASLSIMATEGVAGKKLYVGESKVKNGHVLGLVNLAAFLAQSMKETIQYDACDENSWDFVNGKYPLSNACGQLGQSYQDYHCPDHEKHMECAVDPDMKIEAVTHAKWYGAPAPLFCGPKSEYPTTGFWDHGYECNKSWASPPETCDVYEGQKAGRYDNSIAYASTGGRKDVEGCCWWGRGVIQTTGVCNFGKLNYFLGARAKKDGRPARYPKVDFCKDPEVICASPEHKELKWIAGEFYWMESVQSYDVDGWDYTTELRKFVQSGMTGTSFIDGVSGIVNRGCHNPPCGTGPVDGASERAENFQKVLEVFFGGSHPEVGDLSSLIGLPAAPEDAAAPTPGAVQSPGSSSGGAAKWYPDYNAQYALGKCIDDAPTPSGRPSYDSGEECCNQAYAHQASGACLASLPGASSLEVSPVVATDSSSTPSKPTSDAKPKPSRPQVALSPEAAAIMSSTTFVELENSLESAKGELDSKIFLYQTPAFQWVPSSVYRYDDFKESVNIMATEGVAGKKLYIGEDVDNGHVFGLVNLAAFLAQSMKETIQYDACDENSWDLVNGKYPLSNACGQLGQSYQDYHCPDHEKHMECPVDPNMSVKAVTHAKWYGAPGPLFCSPKSEYPTTGFWDHGYACNKAWASPPETCDVYEGQKAGRYDNSIEVANTAGRTDVEGCCYWGRGVIQTTGVCNFGKLNWFLGAGAKKDGRDARYPEIDFCKDPEAICANPEYKELKWIAGEFYWMESVQSYDVGGWDYTTELRKFVQGGMTGTSFIDAVSGIVNRGCHNPPCGTGPVDGTWERSKNFKKVLDAFFGQSPPKVADLSSDGLDENQPIAVTSSNPSLSSTGSDSALTDVYVAPAGTFTSPDDSAASTSTSELSSLSEPETHSDTSTDTPGPTVWRPETADMSTDEATPNVAGASSEMGTQEDALTSVDTPGPTVWRPETTAHVSTDEEISASASEASSEAGTQEDPVTSVETPGPTVWRPEDADISMAEAFITGTLCDTYQCRRNSNFITYNCGTADIPDNALVVDILFDYEVTVLEAVQAHHVLPALKKQLLNNLAQTLGCQFLPRRNLGAVGDGVILGYQSAQGSDVVDHEKGSCSKSKVLDGEKCIPVVGHLAAYVQPTASVDSILSAKDAVHHVIQYGMASKSYADLAKNVVYVGERKSDRPIPLSNSSSDDEPANSTKSVVIGVVMVVFAITIGVAIFVMYRRRRGTRTFPCLPNASWPSPRGFSVRQPHLRPASESAESVAKDDDASVSSTGRTDTRMSYLDRSYLDRSEQSRMPYHEQLREDQPLGGEAHPTANNEFGMGSFDESEIPHHLHSSDELDIHLHHEAHATTPQSCSEAESFDDQNEGDYPVEGNGGVNFVMINNDPTTDAHQYYSNADEENVGYDDGSNSYDADERQYYDDEGDDHAHSNQDGEEVVFGMPYDGMFYTGQIHAASRLPHGLGTLRSDGDGMIYEGEWHSGQLVANESNSAHPEGSEEDHGEQWSEEYQDDGAAQGQNQYVVGSDDMSRASYMTMD